MKRSGGVGKIGHERWHFLLNAFDHTCLYCGTGGILNLTADHLVPVRRGGSTRIWNVVPSCSTCNHQKDNKLPLIWLQNLPKVKLREVINRWEQALARIILKTPPEYKEWVTKLKVVQTVILDMVKGIQVRRAKHACTFKPFANLTQRKETG